MVSNIQLENAVKEAAETLTSFASTKMEVLVILMETNPLLSSLPEDLPKDSPVIESLVKMLEKLKYADILVACAICEILHRTGPHIDYTDENIKTYFELVITVFEHTCREYYGYYGLQLTRALALFSKGRLTKLLNKCGEELISRLFRHFLMNVSDCIEDSLISNTEKIIELIVEEKKEERAKLLQDILHDAIRQDNQNSESVCWKFGEEVFRISTANVDPVRGISVYDYSQMVANYGFDSGVHLGKALIGKKIRVWQDDLKTYFPVVVDSFEDGTNVHKVTFVGHSQHLNLYSRRWMFESDSSVSG